MEHPPPLTPIPLDYGRPGQPGKRPPIPHAVLKFFAGAILGSLVSTAVWIPAFKYAGSGNQQIWGSMIFIIPGLKIVAAVTCICFRNWRPFGVGLLISIALGALIFFGACAANFKI
jgi:hypothetical protein